MYVVRFVICARRYHQELIYIHILLPCRVLFIATRACSACALLPSTVSTIFRRASIWLTRKASSDAGTPIQLLSTPTCCCSAPRLFGAPVRLSCIVHIPSVTVLPLPVSNVFLRSPLIIIHKMPAPHAPRTSCCALWCAPAIFAALELNWGRVC